MSSWWLPQMSFWMHICSCGPRWFVRFRRLSRWHKWYLKGVEELSKMIHNRIWWYDIESLKSGTENLFNLRCQSQFFPVRGAKFSSLTNWTVETSCFESLTATLVEFGSTCGVFYPSVFNRCQASPLMPDFHKLGLQDVVHELVKTYQDFMY